ncbi:MAG: DUF5677 domain-containing protein [Oscillospiraceae bacterium]|nr:DUF5677 domain-containing protein [Oscillospiraceae bacterium]
MEEKCIALYHRIMRRENFEVAAKDLFYLLISAQTKNPNQPRILYVDIDGHRNTAGGFDSDMLELQKEFGLGFLLPYFTEVHFPLCSVVNTKEQSNDIPAKLEISNAENKRDSSLDELHIENYSKTEFMSEQEVYTYLQQVSAFLRKYNDLDQFYVQMEKEAYDPLGLLYIWRTYMRDLINELFALFCYGNLISAAAMTRTMIECYVFLSILKKEKSEKLLEDWYLCNTIIGSKKYDTVIQNRILRSMELYCDDKNLNYPEIYNRFIKKNENEWLGSIISRKRITFCDVCDYLGEPGLYSDFQEASSFVHSQDIISKTNPFVFYSSIYNKFRTMMSYIYKAIRLFPVSEEMKEEVQELERELFALADIYIR